MKPARHFDNPDLDDTLAAFLELIGGALSERLISVILQGSVVFDDLAPGYGDLDFVAVVRDDLDGEWPQRLRELRRPLREGRHGVFGTMLEGAFLPRRMLDPANRGQAFWWGTSGERVWDENRLGWFVLQLMRERGIVLWGEDLRQEIPPPRREDLLADLQSACKSGLEHGRGGSAKSADWLLTAARCLYWLRRGELSSKSAAADWAYAHAEGEWRELLPQAKELRADPSMTGDVMQWLDGLTPAIREAWREVQRALDDAAARTGRPPD